MAVGIGCHGRRQQVVEQRIVGLAELEDEAVGCHLRVSTIDVLLGAGTKIAGPAPLGRDWRGQQKHADVRETHRFLLAEVQSVATNGLNHARPVDVLSFSFLKAAAPNCHRRAVASLS
jgi:hypothetical protein